MTKSYVQVVTTLGSAEDAQRLARQLVENRLAACVQITGPITSVYRWQGKIEESQEWVCTAKTSAAALERISDAIGQLHPYEVPELIAMPLSHVSPSYAAWIDEQVG